MTLLAPDHRGQLARRLDRLRAGRTDPGDRADPLPYRPIPSRDLAERLATTLDGEVVTVGAGRFVRVEGRSTTLPIDRSRLARLPGQPPAARPMVCLDTETTGLATAAGTVAFLIGLGWWEGDTFRQVQLLLPDHAEEGTLLDELARHLPAGAWLVTYNGRGFDWPLLVTRYRMARRAAPLNDGHLDLLPIVRRLFRHRMTDARLQTAERSLLGVTRCDDVDGWEIPGRYLGFLRGGPAEPLLAVLRHNEQDVRSLARLVSLLEQGYADPIARLGAPRGDLAGLARAFARERRLDEALTCLEAAADAPDASAARRPWTETAGQAREAVARPGVPVGPQLDDEAWWLPHHRPDFGGRPSASVGLAGSRRPAAFDAPWTDERIAVDRAQLLRRLGRLPEAVEAWLALGAGRGRIAVLAWVEVAKLREHRLGDLSGAIEATQRGMATAERRRRLGRPEPALEIDLARRLGRLQARRARVGLARLSLARRRNAPR
ncbi:MAG: ribonuclease H-like domain-containing protein [Candidatus Limnocylindrales bacterium]